jgi:hypothetical protein
VKIEIVSQGPSEDLASYITRVNGELARLGASVKDIKMVASIHESMIAGRVAIPRMLHSILITCEDGQG